LVASAGSGSTVGGSSGRLGVVTRELGTLLAGKGDQLVPLGTLRYLDTVLVGPFLDLAVTPRVKQLIGQRLLSAGR